MRTRNRYKTEGEVLLIPTEEILPSPDQPRRTFSEEGLRGLARSIRENGLLQPLSVCFCGSIPVLVAGERRLRAAKMAGLKAVPCIEVAGDGVDRAVLTLVENLQREEMNCFDTAAGIQRLMCSYGLTQEQAASRLGWAQSTVANKLRLLHLPPRVRDELVAAGMTERHARALLRIEDEDVLRAVLHRMIEDKLTVVQTERLVEDALRGNVPRRRAVPVIKDVRLFWNTVEHAVDVMRRSGIRAETERREEAEYIEYAIRIPRTAERSPAAKSAP